MSPVPHTDIQDTDTIAMLLAFFGPSCSGKSSVASIIAGRTSAEVWSGRDYLRLATSETEAKQLFVAKLRDASHRAELGAGSIIHVVSDPVEAVTVEGCTITAKFAASPEILRERFRKRTGGQLPAGVAEMLDRQLQLARATAADLKFDTSQMHPEIIADAIMVFAQSQAALPDRSHRPQ
jgi:hypothetical protein